jgi:5-methylcytosine-specific restriction endonuclease McrA
VAERERIRVPHPAPARHPERVDLATRQEIGRARGGGSALPGGVRQAMEQAYGADFGAVRTHSDTRADRLNRSLGALAFTTGRDIFFRRDAFSPYSLSGRRLLAHELGHVLQQSGSGPGVVQCKRPENFSTYAEAVGENVYSQRLLKKQKGDTLRQHFMKDFTPTERTNVLAANMGANGGRIRSDEPPHRRLYMQDPNEEPQVDHRYPKSRGGSNSYENAAVLSKTSNVSKSNRLLVEEEPDEALPPYRGLTVDRGEVIGRGREFSAKQRDRIYKANKRYYRQRAIISDEDEETILEKLPPDRFANVDHITPKSDGGFTYYFNAQVLSQTANTSKGGRRRKFGDDPEDAPDTFYDDFELGLTLAQFIARRERLRREAASGTKQPSGPPPPSTVAGRTRSRSVGAPLLAGIGADLLVATGQQPKKKLRTTKV